MSATSFGSGIQWLAPGRALTSFWAVEPASTVATRDSSRLVAAPCRPLISKGVPSFPRFGISAANVEVSAREIFVPFAWIGGSIELSKNARS